MAEAPRIAVGGVSGSGTRAVASILRGAGVYIGADLNESLDNLWFTLLLKRPRRLPEWLWTDAPELFGALAAFEAVMEGRSLDRDERVSVDQALADLAAYGHNNRGDGRGEWAQQRRSSLLRSTALRPAGERWGWKEPVTTLLIQQIARQLEDVRYVHVMRHGLDMAFRADQQDLHTWGPIFDMHPPYAPGPRLPLQYWLAANERAVHQGELLPPGRFMVVRYEDLCRNPKEEVERLLTFADLPAADVETLAESVEPSSSMRIHLKEDLSGFDRRDLERVAALGFGVPGLRPSPLPSRRAPLDGLRVSVAMCTYQGARFLPQQLESIASQTRLPDEMIVCDDGSDDGTTDLLREFADSAPFPVKIEVNSERLGSTKNFEQAIAMCDGDVIFLADQDDVWLPRKIERMAGILASTDDAAAVFSDADLIDEAGRSIGRGLWQTLGFEGDFRRRFAAGEAFELLARANVVTGAATAFRAGFRDLILPIPDNWVQDAWIAILLSAVSRLVVLPERLIRYRVHAGQQIGVPDPDSAPQTEALTRRQHLLRWTQFGRRMRKNERELMRGIGNYLGPVMERLHSYEDRYPSRADVFEVLDDLVRHWQARGRMELEPNRARLVLQELRAGRYHRYSSGLSSAAKDLLLLDRAAGKGRE